MGQSSTENGRRRADNLTPAEHAETPGWRPLSAEELAQGSRSFLAIDRHGDAER